MTQLGEGADVDILATANESTMKAADATSQVDAQEPSSSQHPHHHDAGGPAGVTSLDSSLDGVKLVMRT